MSKHKYNNRYKKLYFFCVNYEEEEMQVYQVISLANIRRCMIFGFDASKYNIKISFLNN